MDIILLFSWHYISNPTMVWEAIIIIVLFFIHSFFQCDFAENMPVAIAPSNPLSSDDISVK